MASEPVPLKNTNVTTRVSNRSDESAIVGQIDNRTGQPVGPAYDTSPYGAMPKTGPEATGQSVNLGSAWSSVHKPGETPYAITPYGAMPFTSAGVASQAKKGNAAVRQESSDQTHAYANNDGTNPHVPPTVFTPTLGSQVGGSTGYLIDKAQREAYEKEVARLAAYDKRNGSSGAGGTGDQDGNSNDTSSGSIGTAGTSGTGRTKTTASTGSDRDRVRDLMVGGGMSTADAGQALHYMADTDITKYLDKKAAATGSSSNNDIATSQVSVIQSSAQKPLDVVEKAYNKSLEASKLYLKNGYDQDTVNKAVAGMTQSQLNEAIASQQDSAVGAFGTDSNGVVITPHEVTGIKIAPGNTRTTGQTQKGITSRITGPGTIAQGGGSWESQGLLKPETDPNEFDKAGISTGNADGTMGAVAKGIVDITEASTNRSPFVRQANADNLNTKGNELLKDRVNFSINGNSIEHRYDSANNSTVIIDKADTVQTTTKTVADVDANGSRTTHLEFNKPVQYMANGAINSEQFYNKDGSYDWSAHNMARTLDIQKGGRGDVDYVTNARGTQVDDTVVNNIPTPSITTSDDKATVATNVYLKSGGKTVLDPMKTDAEFKKDVDSFISSSPNVTQTQLAYVPTASSAPITMPGTNKIISFSNTQPEPTAYNGPDGGIAVDTNVALPNSVNSAAQSGVGNLTNQQVADSVGGAMAGMFSGGSF